MPGRKTYKKEEYSTWISDVRKKTGLSIDEFSENVFRFKNDSIKYYDKRNIYNWEKGTSLPEYKETVVAIAILEYKHDQFLQETKTRIEHVAFCLEKYLQRKLYCRYLEDILVYEAALGIIELKKVPEIRLEIEKKKSKIEFSNDELEKLSLEGHTVRVIALLKPIKTRDELIKFLVENPQVYKAGFESVYRRLRKVYNERTLGQSQLDYKDAQKLYAPQFSNTEEKRIGKTDGTLSREKLIDFCVSLCFPREQINKVLEYAYYSKLSDEYENPESWIEEIEGTTIGSQNWFELIEDRFLSYLCDNLSDEKYNLKIRDIMDELFVDTDFSPLRFSKITTWSLRERLLFILLLGLYIRECKEYPIPTYLFLSELQKKSVLVKKILNSKTIISYEELIHRIILSNINHEDIILVHGSASKKNIRMKETFDSIKDPYFIENNNSVIKNVNELKEEFVYYSQCPDAIKKKVYKVNSNKELYSIDQHSVGMDFNNCYYLLACAYTVLTGFSCKGYKYQECLPVLEFYKGHGNNVYNYIYLLCNLFRMYLGGKAEIINRDDNIGFQMLDKFGRKIPDQIWNFDEILIMIACFIDQIGNEK